MGSQLPFGRRVRGEHRPHRPPLPGHTRRQGDLAFDDGRLAIEGPNGGRVDCHISADPAAYLLVGYGRLERWRPALTGRIVSWGRKPHLAFRLTRLLRSP